MRGPQVQALRALSLPSTGRAPRLSRKHPPCAPQSLSCRLCTPGGSASTLFPYGALGAGSESQGAPPITRLCRSPPPASQHHRARATGVWGGAVLAALRPKDRRLTGPGAGLPSAGAAQGGCDSGIPGIPASLLTALFLSNFKWLLKKKIIYFISVSYAYVLITTLSLHCSAGSSLAAASMGSSPGAGHGLPTAAASRISEQRGL